jgi:hypothetical protein
MKNKSKLVYQNYGTSLLLFINGETHQDAYDKWLSMANWGATSLLDGKEPKYVTDNVISCWTTLEKLKSYLFDINEHLLLLNRPADMGDAELEATAKYKADHEFKF